MEKMRFFYDEEGDVLDISIGKPKKAKSQEIGNDVIVRKDSKGKVKTMQLEQKNKLTTTIRTDTLEDSEIFSIVIANSGKFLVTGHKNGVICVNVGREC
jgi:uncharacterized protein YuzE